MAQSWIFIPDRQFLWHCIRIMANLPWWISLHSSHNYSSMIMALNRTHDSPMKFHGRKLHVLIPMEVFSKIEIIYATQLKPIKSVQMERILFCSQKCLLQKRENPYDKLEDNSVEVGLQKRIQHFVRALINQYLILRIPNMFYGVCFCSKSYLVSLASFRKDVRNF